MLNSIKIACFLISMLMLVGCADVAVSGAQMIYNRHAIQRNLQDHYITMQAYQNLYMKRDDFNSAHIVIATYQGDVLLTGQAPDPNQRTQAEQLVKSIAGIKRLYNLITIASPSSAATRISDAWLTAKIKTKLIASNRVDASKIKVVTENGTVYLMGIVPKQAANEAAYLASTTDGVLKVVKVFSYIHLSRR